MCNIAGYTGNRRAAPILIDMMRRQEGFWSGYYTGIVTIDNGKLYSAKVLGDLDTLLRETDALNLPGNIGLIHGRTPSGGDAMWSYPFIGNDEKLGFVENGSLGSFKGKTDFVPVAEALEAKGYHMISKTTDDVANYPHLSDGTAMHYSDIQCHMVEDNMNQGLEPLDALMKCLRDCPCEDVAVSIHTEHPGKLFVARYNQPMNLARAEGEAYIATSPTAFPDLPYYGVQSLPANAGAIITPEGITVKTPLNDLITVGSVSAGLAAKAYDAVLDLLKNAAEPLPFSALYTVCKDLFPAGVLAQAAPLGYAVLDSLLKEGKAEYVVVTLPGMVEGLTAPSYRIRLKK